MKRLSILLAGILTAFSIALPVTAASARPLDVQAGSSYVFLNVAYNRYMHLHAAGSQLDDNTVASTWDPSDFQNIGGHIYAELVDHGTNLCANASPTNFDVYGNTCTGQKTELWAIFTPPGQDSSHNWFVNANWTWETAFLTDHGPSGYGLGVNAPGSGNAAVWIAGCVANC